MSSILDDVIPSVKADHPVLVIEGLDGTGGRGMVSMACHGTSGRGM